MLVLRTYILHGGMYCMYCTVRLHSSILIIEVGRHFNNSLLYSCPAHIDSQKKLSHVRFFIIIITCIDPAYILHNFNYHPPDSIVHTLPTCVVLYQFEIFRASGLGTRVMRLRGNARDRILALNKLPFSAHSLSMLSITLIAPSSASTSSALEQKDLHRFLPPPPPPPPPPPHPINKHNTHLSLATTVSL